MVNVQKMVDGGMVEYWTCLSFSRLHADYVFRFCDDLVGMCNNIGMVVRLVINFVHLQFCIHIKSI